MALQFAVTTDGSAFGVAQSASETHTAEIADARDENGAVAAQTAHSVTHEAKVDFLLDGKTLPAAGASVTIGNLTGLVTNLEKSESNTDYQKGSLTIQKKDAAVQTAYTAPTT